MKLKQVALIVTAMFDAARKRSLVLGQSEAGFHGIVKEALAERDVIRRSRDFMLSKIETGKFDHLSPRHLHGFEAMTHRSCDTAMRNVVDFEFESAVLANIGETALNRYMQDIQRTLTWRGTSNSSFGEAALIETVHHMAIFSIAVSLGRDLRSNGGKTQMVLVHQGLRDEPRLNMTEMVLRKFVGIKLLFVQLKEGWLNELKQLISPTTAVVYLADMPPVSPVGGPSRSDRSRRLTLSDSPSGSSVDIETLSAAPQIAKMLNLRHFVMDYPGKDTISLEAVNDVLPDLRCELSDWVFWPYLNNA